MTIESRRGALTIVWVDLGMCRECLSGAVDALPAERSQPAVLQHDDLQWTVPQSVLDAANNRAMLRLVEASIALDKLVSHQAQICTQAQRIPTAI